MKRKSKKPSVPIKEKLRPLVQSHLRGGRFTVKQIRDVVRAVVEEQRAS